MEGSANRLTSTETWGQRLLASACGRCMTKLLLWNAGLLLTGDVSVRATCKAGCWSGEVAGVHAGSWHAATTREVISSGRGPVPLPYSSTCGAALGWHAPHQAGSAPQGLAQCLPVARWLPSLIH
jgi:hypothetical protein